MGIYDFSRKMFISEFKRNLFYILILGTATLIVISTINISYVPEIYVNDNTIIEIGSMPRPEMGPDAEKGETFYFTLGLIQRSNLFLLVMITIVFIIITTHDFVISKGKEMAFIISNGGSIMDLTRYISYMVGVSFWWGLFIGLIFGISIVPIINSIMFIFVGKWGDVFLISLQAVGTTVSFMIIVYFLILMYSVGYVYRRTPLQLLEIGKKKKIVDNRAIKIPGIIFLMLYIVTIYFNLTLLKEKGAVSGTLAVGGLGLVSIWGIIKYTIPELMRILNRKKIMYKKLRKIYWSNFLSLLNNSLIYILFFYGTVYYLSNNIAKSFSNPGMIYNTIFVMVGTSIIITFCLGYKLKMNEEQRIELYKQLKLFGYTKKEVLQIATKEIIIFLVISLSLPIILLLTSYIIYVYLGAFEFKIAINLFLGIVLPLVVIGFVICSKTRKRIVVEIFK